MESATSTPQPTDASVPKPPAPTGESGPENMLNQEADIGAEASGPAPDEMARRPTRRASARGRRSRANTTKPNPELYIGYADDSESVDMIMKKFAAMEKLKEETAAMAAGTAQSEQGSSSPDSTGPSPSPTSFTSEQYERLFKMTSSFSVNELSTYDGGSPYTEWDLGDDADDDEEEFFGDANLFWDDDGRPRKRKRKRTSGGGSRKKDADPMLAFSSAARPWMMLKRRQLVSNPDAVVYQRIPPTPIPMSWAKRINAFDVEEKVQRGAYYECVNSVVDHVATLKGLDFQAVLFDPPWHVPGVESSGKFTVADFKKLKAVASLVPAGFLYIWVAKHVTAKVLNIVESWGFTYVENLVWVKKGVNNRVVRQEAPYFSKSKDIMLICRKQSKIKAVNDKVDMRHQRSPDVLTDYIRHDTNGRELKPETAYTTIETMLPSAHYKEEHNRGQFLELFAPKNTLREGWTKIAQTVYE